MSSPENPYQPPIIPGEVHVAGDTLDPAMRRRPLGVTLLALAAAAMGLCFLGVLIFLASNWQENNEGLVRQRIPPPDFWAIVGSTTLLMFAGAVGMWRGTKWGWWLACGTIVMYVCQGLFGVLVANLRQGAPSLETLLSLGSLRSLIGILISGLLLAYWVSVRVRRYFRTERTSPITAILVSGGTGIGGVVLLLIALRVLFTLVG